MIELFFNFDRRLLASQPDGVVGVILDTLGQEIAVRIVGRLVLVKCKATHDEFASILSLYADSPEVQVKFQKLMKEIRNDDEVVKYVVAELRKAGFARRS